ncbi:MAG: LPXTG cell wall anchor domain-containing protein [Mycobacterium sp.]|nr:LPXTG cell wall anchor domain-containing protein [Mycobacterium sp.]
MSAEESPRGNAFARFAVQYWAPIALMALAAVFIGQNRDHQQVHFLWATVESPMWLLLATMLLIGVVVGLLLRRRRR